MHTTSGVVKDTRGDGFKNILVRFRFWIISTQVPSFHYKFFGNFCTKMVNCFYLHKAKIDWQFHGKFCNFVARTYKAILISIGRIQIHGGSALVSLWIPIWIHHFSLMWIRIRSMDLMTKIVKFYSWKKTHFLYKNCKICIPRPAWSHSADHRLSQMSSLPYLIHEKPESIDVSLPAVTAGLLYWNTLSFHPSIEKENVKKTKNLAVVGTGTVTERRVTTNRYARRQQISVAFFFILVHGPSI